MIALMTPKLLLKYYLLLFLIFCLINPIANVFAHQSSGEVCIYLYKSSTLEKLLSYFNSKPELNITVYNITDPILYERFFEIINMLRIFVIDKNQSADRDRLKTCLGCELKRLAQKEIIKLSSPPLIGFFYNRKLSAVTIGITDKNIIDKALEVNIKDHAIVFTPNGTYILNDEAVRTRLEELFHVQWIRKKAEISAFTILVSTLLLALSDSVNPCTFAVFTALLLIAFHSLNKKRATVIGFSFIAAIFIGYYALGIGLLPLLTNILYIDKIVAIVGLFVSVFSILRGLKSRFKSPVPKSVKKFIDLQLRKSSIDPIASFIFGLVTTVCLLPCSGGPYIIGLGLLSTLKPFQAYALLALYNVVFITPLILILMILLLFSKYSYKIKIFRSTKLSAMELLSGIILMAICLFILLENT